MSSEVRTVRSRQYRTDENSTQWTRKMNRDGSWSEWERSDDNSVPGPEADPLYLYVVMELQAPGEPLHWSLFVARETGEGTVYQVTGDATHMHYNHAVDVDQRNSESFHNAYQLCELSNDGLRRLDIYANQVPPPQAENRASVTENCQGWVIRVLRELQSVNVVDVETVNSMEALVQPI